MLMGNMESINRDKDNFLRQLLSNAADVCIAFDLCLGCILVVSN